MYICIYKYQTLTLNNVRAMASGLDGKLISIAKRMHAPLISIIFYLFELNYHVQVFNTRMKSTVLPMLCSSTYTNSPSSSLIT